ncbi:trp region conserved hypothetical membrane protein [Sanguibacter gelidistatuariae]|uniref:Trp region conserved hypothetical membrane protein n=1 Tax=Sanguibacter gelidistatuariae TaxID=1814289 RepID=A0A1G6TBR5_9MICO|nr:Trp biosynthesis-associated membrane protein [Sanguibacter gelidistatuariae]SDD26572.1 trp region conserved hypothetical membrane protein [Sanguibacter gelidistatuariae]
MSEDASAAANPRAARRRVVLSLVLLGAAAVATAAPTWLTTYASTVLNEQVKVVVTGTSAAPGVSAAALVVVAAGLALGLVGRIARWFSLLVVIAGGLVIAGSGFNFIRSPDAAARSGVADATGVIGVVGDVTVSYAPYLALVCGLAIIAVAVRAAVAPIDWGSRTTKYDTPVHGQDAPQESAPDTDETDLDERDAWDALTQGDDPT